MSTEVGKLYVKFDADGRPYIQGLQQIDRRTSQFTRDQQSAFDKFGANIGRTIKTGMAVGAAAVVAGGTLITKSLIKTAASYEYEMSRIKAITQATSDEMAGMSELALELGKDTVFSASEVAAAMTELAKAGQSVGDITGGAIQSVLDLAGAGELQVARAAEIVSNAMNMFGIAASEAAMVADTLAAGANASSVEVSDLAESLMFVGGQAASLGIPFQTVIALISELGNQGIKGSTAGTALSTMLMNLTSATEPGAEALAKMGIEVFDTSGKLKDMDVILGDLNKAMSGLSDAEIADLGRKIFGGGMDATTFKILVKGGSDALKDMTERVSVAGEAGRVNAVKMDNFNGSLEQLRGSVETLTIKVGTPMINALRPFVDKLSEGVDWATEFYDGLQNLSGWEGADLTGKIKIAWGELTTQMEDWFSGASQLKLNPWSDLDYGTTGKDNLRGWGESIGEAAGDMLTLFMGREAGQSDSVWVQAGWALLQGFWNKFIEKLKGAWTPLTTEERTRIWEEFFKDPQSVQIVAEMNAEAEAEIKRRFDQLAEENSTDYREKWLDGIDPELANGAESVLDDIDAASAGRRGGGAFFAGFDSAARSAFASWNPLADVNAFRSMGAQGGSAYAQGGFGGSGSGAAIFDFANNYLGTPYVFGGQSPGGFDCSGLMWYAYQHFGIDIPRLSQDQFAYGRPVSNPRVGDLVFFRSSGTNSAPGHVGMYAGNGMFLEAPYTGASVRYSYLANRSDYVGARAYTYHDGGMIGSQGGSGEVLIHAQAGERVLSREQSRLFETFVHEIGQIADEIREGNKEEEAFNEAFLARLSERLDALNSYVSRESARLAMQRAEFAPGGFDASEMAAMVHTLTYEIEHLDAAVAEAEAQLNEAKWMQLPQAEINRLAENLFGLRTEAADARRELEELERVPLEQALDHWANAADNLSRIMDVLSDHSNSFALMGAQFPGLMGSLGGSYQTNLDLMRGSTLPSDIMGYGGAALSDLTSMYRAEQSQLDRALDHTLQSIEDSEDAWERAWQARADALDDSVDQQREALDRQLEDLSKAHRDELEALNRFYDDKLRLLDDREREITRAEQRNQMQRGIAGLEDELRILRGQGYYTEADIARMRELETQIQEQRDEMTRQEAAWAREDERTRLQRERDEAVASLEQQQEMARIALEDQVEAARKALDAQREAMDREREQQRQHFEDLRRQAEAAHQAELDRVIEKYAALMQEVIDAQNEMLGEAGTYQNAGQALGLAFAQGIMDAIPAIQAAAQAAAEAAAQYLELNSPADKGPLSTLDHWWDAFAPTLYQPLVAQDFMRPVMDTYGPSQGPTVTEEHIYLHTDPGSNIDMDVLVDQVSRKIGRRVEKAAWGA